MKMLRRDLSHLRAASMLAAGLMLTIQAAETQPAQPSVPGKYTGPGSCSSTSCHGGVQPRNETTVLQNEYSTWAVRDKHTHAYIVLTNDVGKRMGRILNIQPEKNKKCTDCHALEVPLEQKAKTFDSNDGVSCESCHGPSSGWLGPHTTRDWTYAKSVELGMYDTRDLIKRSERCLSCHLGTAEKYVDHEMIAAGHPDLYFEQGSYEALMPKHWKDYTKDPWIDVKTVATGQAVQLRENMRRISRSANRFWPEYAELDCFACHHSLTAAKDSWRQERGYPGRRAGNPPYNMSRFAVFQVVANDLDRGAAGQLDGEVRRVYELVSNITADRAQIASAANSAAEAADRMAHRLAGMQLDQAATVRMIKNISADADRIAAQGERSAEQAAMTLQSLYIAYSSVEKTGNEQVRAAINGLFPMFENPSAFVPGAFARQMRNVGALIR